MGRKDVARLSRMRRGDSSSRRSVLKDTPPAPAPPVPEWPRLADRRAGAGPRSHGQAAGGRGRSWVWENAGAGGVDTGPEGLSEGALEGGSARQRIFDGGQAQETGPRASYRYAYQAGCWGDFSRPPGRHASASHSSGREVVSEGDPA